VGVATLALALLHVAIAIGGPKWYAFFGAPQGLVRLAAFGNARAPGTCIAVALALTACSAYAFSGAGYIPRLPLLRPVLSCIGLAFTLRGIAFPLLAISQPAKLIPYCGACGSLNSFVVVTSVAALTIGVMYLAGAVSTATRRQSRAQAGR
jgi:hypothetical protein